MGLFKLLWSGQTNNHYGSDIVIPLYGEGSKEDCVDLQIRSLMYMFRRCDIVNSKPFSSGQQQGRLLEHSSTSKITLDQLDLGSAKSETEKLDLLYNKAKFDLLFQDDPHRILIDWSKNKFRSLCILSSHPIELKTLPKFDVPNFSFAVLHNDSSEAEYIETLANSDIYTEHLVSVDLEARKKIVKNALALVKGGATRTLTMDERAFIIKYYLNKVAVEVQVERLYRGMALKAEKERGSVTPVTPTSRSPEREEANNKRSGRSPFRSSSPERYKGTERRLNMSPDRFRMGIRTPDRSPERSPERTARSSQNASPTQGPRKMKSSSALLSNSTTSASITISPPSSPTKNKLSKQTSAFNLRLNMNEAPNLAPPVPQEEDIKTQLLSQARIAVRKKIDDEKLALKKLRAANRASRTKNDAAINA